MGRRHLRFLLVLAAAVVVAAPAGAAIRWKELGRGAAVGAGPAAPVAFVAADRAGTKRFAARLPAAGKAALARVDSTRIVAVAVFASFGCKDHRVAVTDVARQGGTLVVSLVERPLEPGATECQAIYPTYRLLSVPKASLAKPYPTRAAVRLG